MAMVNDYNTAAPAGSSQHISREQAEMQNNTSNIQMINSKSTVFSRLNGLGGNSWAVRPWRLGGRCDSKSAKWAEVGASGRQPWITNEVQEQAANAKVPARRAKWVNGARLNGRRRRRRLVGANCRWRGPAR